MTDAAELIDCLPLHTFFEMINVRPRTGEKLLREDPDFPTPFKIGRRRHIQLSAGRRYIAAKAQQASKRAAA
jgi:hypothetical protein